MFTHVYLIIYMNPSNSNMSSISYVTVEFGQRYPIKRQKPTDNELHIDNPDYSIKHQMKFPITENSTTVNVTINDVKLAIEHAKLDINVYLTSIIESDKKIIQYQDEDNE